MKNKKRGILQRNNLESYKEDKMGFDFSNINITKTLKTKTLNNCVVPELGLHILNESKRDIHPELFRCDTK